MKTSSDAPRKPKKSYLSRKTLYSKVHRASEESIVLIIAPPGYGKSAFASEWYWSLAQCDAAEVAYFRIEPQDPHSVEQIEEFLSGANGAESFSNWHIIIEEANLLAHDEAARIFPCLVRATNAGAKALLTAASWTDSLTQMYMRQEAVVLGKNELAFSEQEVKACLEALAGKSQAREYVKRVFDFTQGWPAGVHLLAINAEGNKEAFSFGKNKYIDAYFSAFLEETFSSAEIDFISKTACLDELSADVCDYVTGRTDGRETLKKLELAGAYLTFDGNDTDATCHYDRPFRTWLRSSLLLKSKTLCQQANNRASSFYASRNDAARSVKHMLMAGDSMSNFKEIWRALDFSGKGYRHDELMLWISEINPQEILENPLFDIMAAWFCIRSGRAQDARDCVALCRSAIDGQADFPSTSKSIIDTHLACIEAKCLNMEANDEAFISTANTLLEDEKVNANIGLHCILSHSLAESYEHIGEIELSQSRYQESLALADLCDDVFARALSIYSIARHKLMTGCFLESEELCRTGMEHCTDSYRGLLNVLLVRLHLITGEPQKAQELAKEADALLTQGSNADFRFELNIAEAFLCELEGDLDRANSLIFNSVATAKSEAVRQRGILQRTQIEWARLLLRKRDYNRCRELLREIKRESIPEKGETFITIAMAESGLSLANGEYEKALEIARKALAEAKRLDFVVYWIDLKVTEARILAAMKEKAGAYLCMSDALDNGARFGIRVSFLRDREEIFDLLNESQCQRKLKRTTRRFCESLLREMNEQKPDDAPMANEHPVNLRRDLLTKREQEILSLLNKGLTRKEISLELGISYNTAKAHIGHIYEKLEVDNKLDAFHAARETIGL